MHYAAQKLRLGGSGERRLSKPLELLAGAERGSMSSLSASEDKFSFFVASISCTSASSC